MDKQAAIEACCGHMAEYGDAEVFSLIRKMGREIRALRKKNAELIKSLPMPNVEALWHEPKNMPDAPSYLDEMTSVWVRLKPVRYGISYALYKSAKEAYKFELFKRTITAWINQSADKLRDAMGLLEPASRVVFYVADETS